MKQRYLFWIFSLLLLSSCFDKKIDIKMMDLFVDKEETASLKEFSNFEIDSVRTPYMMACLENRLLFADMSQSSFISAFDKNSGEWMFYGLHRGNGPDEYLHLSNMQVSEGKLFLWDSGRSEVDLLKLECDSFCMEKRVPMVADSCLVAAFQVTPIHNGCFIASGIIRGSRLVVLDAQGKVCSSFGKYPLADKQMVDDVEMAFAHQGNALYREDRRRFVISDMMGESIAFFDISDVKHPCLCKEYSFVQPAYHKADDGSVIFDKDCKVGFVALGSSKDYCIGLFNGDMPLSEQSYGGDKLLFFDWDGNPVKSVLLDEFYSCLVVDEENNRILLLGTDPTTLDYKLSVLDL